MVQISLSRYKNYLCLLRTFRPLQSSLFSLLTVQSLVGQWGRPTVSWAGVFGMLTGLLASLIESVGDYHCCARFSGARPPPKHAMNRGIAAEGIGVFTAGAFGCGIDTTAYGENIGAIGITKVKTMVYSVR